MGNERGGMANSFKKDILKSQAPFTRNKEYIRHKREEATIDEISRDISSIYKTKQKRKSTRVINRVINLIVTVFVTILFLGMLEILALMYIPSIGNEILYLLKDHFYSIFNLFF